VLNLVVLKLTSRLADVNVALQEYVYTFDDYLLLYAKISLTFILPLGDT
jgi:hypothetical protein